jgi:hypothetical protein
MFPDFVYRFSGVQRFHPSNEGRTIWLPSAPGAIHSCQPFEIRNLGSKPAGIRYSAGNLNS